MDEISLKSVSLICEIFMKSLRNLYRMEFRNLFAKYWILNKFNKLETKFSGTPS